MVYVVCILLFSQNGFTWQSNIIHVFTHTHTRETTLSLFHNFIVFLFCCPWSANPRFICHTHKCCACIWCGTAIIVQYLKCAYKYICILFSKNNNFTYAFTFALAANQQCELLFLFYWFFVKVVKRAAKAVEILQMLKCIQSDSMPKH